MILLKLVLFIGMCLGITYGIEFLLPPFGKLFYTNPLDILLSVSQSISYGIGIPTKYSLAFTIFIIGIFPLILVIKLGRRFKKKKRYKF